MLTECTSAPLILLVEDDPSHVAAIHRSFQEYPGTFRIATVDTLHSAREAIKQRRPTLILTDYRLPDGKGSDLVLLASGTCPVIVMTARGSEQIAVQTLKAGVQDYVVKSAEAFVHMPETVAHSIKAWELRLARTQAEDALKQSEEKHRHLYERLALAAKSASFGVWDWDIASDEVIWDDTMFEIYGISKSAPMSLEAWINVVYPGDFASTLESIQQNLDEGGREAEFKFVRPDGEIRHIYSAEGFIRNDANEIIRIVGVNTDITKRKQAEEDLRNYARRLIEMEEDLRRKIATELHDEIGRDLTVLGINFSIIHSNLTEDLNRNLSARIEDSAKLIESISRTTRSIMAGLRPPVLDDYGLVSALRWHSDLFSSRTGIVVSVQTDEPFPRLHLEVELALFRISQEALMNSAKHAHASSIDIALRKGDGMIVFTIADNGNGFSSPTHSHPQNRGWGLKIMQERAELIGANFILDSIPEQGTSITVKISMERCLDAS
jgi:PAS domain S-box-containing protein